MKKFVIAAYDIINEDNELFEIDAEDEIGMYRELAKRITSREVFVQPYDEKIETEKDVEKFFDLLDAAEVIISNYIMI